MAEGNLTGEPGEDVEPEGGDENDERLAEKAHPACVAEEAETGYHLERQQHQNEDEESHGPALGCSREDPLLVLVGHVQEWPAPHTRRISSVPNKPYGRTSNTASIMR